MNRPILLLIRRAGVLAALPVLMLAAGCSGTPTNTPAPEPTAANVQGTVPVGATTVPGQPTPTGGAAGAAVKAYDHTADYSTIAGQVSSDGNCVIVTYVSPLVLVAADKYNNHFALLAGSWDAAAIKNGDWVIVHGRPADPGSSVPGCNAPAYVVSSIARNPIAP